jgi:hypothetical protein
VLPLLSHVLRETWGLRRSKNLSLDRYEAAGGLHGAIARIAERVHAELSEPERGFARRLLLRLIVPGEDTDYTCRTVARAELDAPVHRSRVGRRRGPPRARARLPRGEHRRGGGRAPSGMRPSFLTSTCTSSPGAARS